MAETLGSLQQTLDPTSLILSQFSDPLNSNNAIRFLTDSYFMERGPRYDSYAQLRESKLQSKRLKLEEVEPFSEIPRSEYSPPLEKSVNFEEDLRVSSIPRPGFSRKSARFNGVSTDCDENVQVCEIPRSEYSPSVKKSVKFQGNLGKIEEDERVSRIPKPEFLRKSAKVYGVSSNSDENKQVCEIPRSEYSPTVKKSVKFQGNAGRKQGYSVLAQSVPDFSSALRKENRRPTPESSNVNRIPRIEKSATPPASMLKRDRMYGSVSKYGGGSKSVNSGEKQSSGRMNMMMGRKSYANIEELKGLSIAASNAINGETRAGRKSNVLRKSTVFTTKYY